MAGYRKIDPRIWYDAKFRGLSDDGKLLFLHLLTHPELSCVGAMVVVPPSVASLVAWRGATAIPRVLRALKELSPLVFYDRNEQVLFFPRFFRYNPPLSPTHVKKAWLAALDRLPEGTTRSLVAANCLDYLDHCSVTFRDAIPGATLDAIKGATTPCQPGATLGDTEQNTSDPEAEAVILREEKNPPVVPPSRRCRLPDDFTLTDKRRYFATKAGVRDPDREFDQFTDHFRGSGDRKLDWDATWRKWCRNAAPGGSYASRSGNHDFPLMTEEEHIESIRRDVQRSRARARQEPNPFDAA